MPAAGGQPGFGRIMESYPRPLDDTTVGGQAMLSKLVVQYSPVVGNPNVPLQAQLIARDVFGSTPKDHTSKAGHEAPNIVTPIPSDDLSF